MFLKNSPLCRNFHLKKFSSNITWHLPSPKLSDFVHKATIFSSTVSKFKKSFVAVFVNVRFYGNCKIWWTIYHKTSFYSSFAPSHTFFVAFAYDDVYATKRYEMVFISCDYFYEGCVLFAFFYCLSGDGNKNSFNFTKRKILIVFMFSFATGYCLVHNYS